MKNFELTVSKEEKFYTPFPGPIADKVSDWLTRNNVENRVFMRLLLKRRRKCVEEKRREEK